MSKYDVKPEGLAWDELRRHVAALHESMGTEEINLVQFAKSYEALANAMLGVAQAHGLSSLRFSGAAKALSLRTPKAKLESFLAEP